MNDMTKKIDGFMKSPRAPIASETFDSPTYVMRLSGFVFFPAVYVVDEIHLIP